MELQKVPKFTFGKGQLLSAWAAWGVGACTEAVGWQLGRAPLASPRPARAAAVAEHPGSRGGSGTGPSRLAEGVGRCVSVTFLQPSPAAWAGSSCRKTTRRALEREHGVQET